MRSNTRGVSPKNSAILTLAVIAACCSLFLICLPRLTFAQSANCYISPSPSSVSSGNYSVLYWSSGNASSFYISGVGSEPTDTSGSSYVYPTQTTTYTGTVSGYNDSSTVQSAVESAAYSYWYTYYPSWSQYPADSWPPYTTLEQLELIYYAYFDRPGDQGGMSYWGPNYYSSGGENSVAQDFGMSGEAEGDYPFLAYPSSGGESGFIDSLYERILDRAPDATGYAYWMNELSNDVNYGNTSAIYQFPLTFALGAENGSTGYCSATVTVTPPPQPPTCSVSFSQDPSPYSSAGAPVLLSWSSSNASEVYINNIGWVSPSGSTYVASQQNTDYSCFGYSSSYGYGSETSSSLTVTPPASPTVSIAASSTSIQTGQSTNILADFAAGSGDILTADNIDEPLSTGLGASTNPDPSKTITFSTATPGTYTFYARATTDYYSAWTTYAQINVTVTAAPKCTESWSCSGNTIVQTNTNCSTTNLASCVSPAFCSNGSSACQYSVPQVNQALQALPSLVRAGETTTVSWNVSYVTGCTVSGTNGDSWTGISGSHVSRPIESQTTYTLSCTGQNGSPVSESAAVNVAPAYEEL